MRTVRVYTHPFCGPSRLLINKLKKSKLECEIIDIRGGGLDLLHKEVKATPTTLLLDGENVTRTFVGRDTNNIIVDAIKEFLGGS